MRRIEASQEQSASVSGTFAQRLSEKLERAKFTRTLYNKARALIKRLAGAQYSVSIELADSNPKNLSLVEVDSSINDLLQAFYSITNSARQTAQSNRYKFGVSPESPRYREAETTLLFYQRVIEKLTAKFEPQEHPQPKFPEFSAKFNSVAAIILLLNMMIAVLSGAGEAEAHGEDNQPNLFDFTTLLDKVGSELDIACEIETEIQSVLDATTSTLNDARELVSYYLKLGPEEVGEILREEFVLVCRETGIMDDVDSDSSEITRNDLNPEAQGLADKLGIPDLSYTEQTDNRLAKKLGIDDFEGPEQTGSGSLVTIPGIRLDGDTQQSYTQIFNNWPNSEQVDPNILRIRFGFNEREDGIVEFTNLPIINEGSELNSAIYFLAVDLYSGGIRGNHDFFTRNVGSTEEPVLQIFVKIVDEQVGEHQNPVSSGTVFFVRGNSEAGFSTHYLDPSGLPYPNSRIEITPVNEVREQIGNDLANQYGLNDLPENSETLTQVTEDGRILVFLTETEAVYLTRSVASNTSDEEVPLYATPEASGEAAAYMQPGQALMVVPPDEYKLLNFDEVDVVTDSGTGIVATATPEDSSGEGFYSIGSNPDQQTLLINLTGKDRFIPVVMGGGGLSTGVYWVPADLVEINSSDFGTINETVNNAEEASLDLSLSAVTELSVQESMVVINQSGVNIRSGAGTDYDILGNTNDIMGYSFTFTPGSERESGSYTWYPIRLDGQEAWVADVAVEIETRSDISPQLIEHLNQINHTFPGALNNQGITGIDNPETLDLSRLNDNQLNMLASIEVVNGELRMTRLGREQAYRNGEVQGESYLNGEWVVTQAAETQTMEGTGAERALTVEEILADNPIIRAEGGLTAPLAVYQEGDRPMFTFRLTQEAMSNNGPDYYGALSNVEMTGFYDYGYLSEAAAIYHGVGGELVGPGKEFSSWDNLLRALSREARGGGERVLEGRVLALARDSLQNKESILSQVTISVPTFSTLNTGTRGFQEVNLGEVMRSGGFEIIGVNNELFSPVDAREDYLQSGNNLSIQSAEGDIGIFTEDGKLILLYWSSRSSSGYFPGQRLAGLFGATFNEFTAVEAIYAQLQAN